jgi:alkylhydroperoxidase family enzyme
MSATPRIEFDDLPESLREQLRPRVERLGYLGEFFQVAAHQPDALGHFVAFTEALREALPARFVEIIALTVARDTANDYERTQHERLAMKLGVPENEVRALSIGDRDTLDLADDERAALELARCVVDARGRSCQDAYGRLEQLAGAKVAVACLMTACRYLAHATMANTWGVRQAVPSPFDVEPAHG